MKHTLKWRTLVVAVVCIAALLAFTACGSKSFSLQASQVSADVLGEQAYATLTDIATNHKDRTYAAQQDIALARSFADMLRACGYEPSQRYSVQADGKTEYGLQSYDYMVQNESGEKQQYTAYNVKYGITRPQATQTIVLAANYGTSNATVDGSYESGAGVAVLLTVARAIAAQDIGYNIEIVLLGADNASLYGSQAYYDSLTPAARDQIALYIAFDQPVGGDYLYLYGRDWQTDYQDYFYAVAQTTQTATQPIPADKHVVRGKYTDNATQEYFHIGMIGQGYYFQNIGIPTLSVASRNWSDASNPYGVERAGLANVQYTESDSLLEMNNRLGGADKTARALGEAAAVIVAGLTEQPETLVQVLNAAQEQAAVRGGQEYGVQLALEITLKVLAVAAVIALLLLARKYVRNHKDAYTARMQQAQQQHMPQQQNVDVFGEDLSAGTHGQNGSDDNTGGSDGVFEDF